MKPELRFIQEYPTLLTANVVTRKLDVREAAADLPEPSVEPVVASEAGEAIEEIDTGGLDE